MFSHDCPLAVKPASTPRCLLHKKKTWRDSLLIDILLSAVSVLVVARLISEVPEGVTNYSVYRSFATRVPQLKICDFSGEAFKGFEVL